MSYNSITGLGSHSGTVGNHWALQDDAASTVVTDSLGNNNATLVTGENTSDRAATGPNSWATSSFDFASSGNDDGVELNNFGDSDEGTFLIRAEIPSSPSTSSLLHFSSDSAADQFGPHDELYLQVNTDRGIDVEIDGQGGAAAVAEASPVTAGWHSFAITWNRSSSTLTLYIDGVQAAQDTSHSWDPFVFTYAYIARTPAGSSRAFGGKVADAAQAATVLTGTQILDWHNGTEPINSVAPSIPTSGQVGTPLVRTAGTWGLDSPFSSGSNGTIELGYQWTRSNDGTGTGEADISGATAIAYTPTASDLGKFLRVRERGTNDGGFDSDADTNSNFTAAIAAAGTVPTSRMTPPGLIIGPGKVIGY